VRKDRVGDFVPVALQGTLFVELVEGREDLQDRPLFLLDEWVAHNNGAAVATDRIRHDLWNAGNRPEVLYEQAQLTVYALALARAIEASEPRYFDREPQFLEFLAAELRRSRDIYREGRYMGPLASDQHEQYWRFFQASSAAQSLRTFVRRTFGDRWSREVLGGECRKIPCQGGRGQACSAAGRRGCEHV